MPNATINIHVDASFLTTSGGGKNVVTEFSARPDDNIGERNIVAVYTVEAGYNTTIDADVEYTTSTTTSGFTSTALTFELNTVSSGIVVSLVDYSIPITTYFSGSQNVIHEYFRKDTKTSGVQFVPVTSVMGQAISGFYAILHSFYNFGSVASLKDLDALYTAGNDYDYSDPESYYVIHTTRDLTTFYRASSTVSGAIMALVDSRFAGYVLDFKPYDMSYYFHVCTGDYAISDAYNFEASSISGGVDGIRFGLLCAVSGTKYIPFVSHCGLETEPYYNFDIISELGRISYLYFEPTCGVSGVSGFHFDVDLLSLKISNFSLTEGEFINADGTICVDITDDEYSVVTSGTYFIINGTVASGIFSPITDGYRMCYDPVDDFVSIIGSTQFRVHAQNSNNDVLEQDFYLTSGYIVEYKNQEFPEDKFGFGKQVTVRISAENFASCPGFDADSHYFETRPHYLSDLGARIVVIPIDSRELPASITPDTELIFLYGKTFRVEITAKDFAGNEMEPYIFEFRIEDKPE